MRAGRVAVVQPRLGDHTMRKRIKKKAAKTTPQELPTLSVQTASLIKSIEKVNARVSVIAEKMDIAFKSDPADFFPTTTSKSVSQRLDYSLGALDSIHGFLDMIESEI